ncbi:MAG: F0F1 ATP synthase subunit delta [Candidatus Omnitrophica bacterium]|nr:F0F1 ATP synthase subunit delta [Candidatus Omnitrophota bacterium]
MNFGIVFVVFVLQVVLALIVVAVLKVFLGKELIKVALERFETLKLQEDIAQIKEISVFSHSPLESDIQTRIKTVAAGKFKGIPLNLAVNSALEGGMVIMVGSTVIDCSSKTRLSSLWGGQ